jgi:non-heme chloroperoxidase
VTEIKKIPNRGQALTIDSGWREVAETALDFMKRFVPSGQQADAQRTG